MVVMQIQTIRYGYCLLHQTIPSITPHFNFQSSVHKVWLHAMELEKGVCVYVVEEYNFWWQKSLFY